MWRDFFRFFAAKHGNLTNFDCRDPDSVKGHVCMYVGEFDNGKLRGFCSSVRVHLSVFVKRMSRQ